MRILPVLLLVTCVTATPAVAVGGTPRLSLDDALAIADRRNPQILELRRDLEELRRRIGRGEARSAERAVGDASTVKITERRRAARLASAEAMLEHERVETAAKVRAAFARVVAAYELVSLARSMEEVRETVARVAANAQTGAPSADANQAMARIRVAQAKLDRLWVERRGARAAADLLMLLSATGEEFHGVSGTLPSDPIAMPELEPAVSGALARRSDLAAARRHYEAALDSQDLSRVGSARIDGPGTAAPDDVADADATEAELRRAHESVVKLERMVPHDVAAAGARVALANRALQVLGESGLASFEDVRTLFDALPTDQRMAALSDAYDLQRQAFLAREELAIAGAEFRRALGER